MSSPGTPGRGSIRARNPDAGDPTASAGCRPPDEPQASAGVAEAERRGSASSDRCRGTTVLGGTRVELTWLGQSCVRIEKDGTVLVIDPGLAAPAHALDDADA